MFKRLKQDQVGAASMIVVIFMSIILSILTIGFVRLALDEQRQSADDDLAARAYYAAESGLEDAKRAIGDTFNGQIAMGVGGLNEAECLAPAGFNPRLSDEFDTEYVCQLIDFQPDTYRAEFSSPSQSRQIDIRPVDQNGNPVSYRYLTLRWHIDDSQSNDGDGIIDNGLNGGLVQLYGSADTQVANFPRQADWDSPAMFEMTIISYPNSIFTAANVISGKSFLVPTDNGTTSDINPFAGNGQRVFVGCTPNAGNYACEARFDMATTPATNRVVRLNNWYVPSTIEVALTNDADQPVFFDGSQAVIDVTGRAGEVYRRVEAVLDISQPSVLSDFAIQSATDICKNFSITDNPADFRAGNTSCE